MYFVWVVRSEFPVYLSLSFVCLFGYIRCVLYGLCGRSFQFVKTNSFCLFVCLFVWIDQVCFVRFVR